MPALVKKKPMWITRDGESVTIEGMSSSHLLAAIHMIERTRLNAMSEMVNQTISLDNFSYYKEFPESYNELIKEAKKRQLIGR